MTLWGVWGVMGSPMESLGTSFWDPLGVIFRALGVILGALGGSFGDLWGALGRLFGTLVQKTSLALVALLVF